MVVNERKTEAAGKIGMPKEQTGMLTDETYFTIYRHEETELPIIPIKLFDMGIPDTEKWHVLSIGTSNAWVLTGLRGSGKSLTLAFIIGKALSCDMPVWSNMNVRYMLQHENGSLELKETKPMDWNLLYAMDKGLQGGAVAIDEVQYFGDSRRSSSLKNQLLNAVIMQMRHRTLDFYYTVKNLGWIDSRMRYETDIEINCTDCYTLTPEIQKGCFIQWLVRDLSGTWTGEPYAETMHRDYSSENYRYNSHVKERGLELEVCAALWWLWYAYSTEEVISLEDAFGGVQLNLDKRQIGKSRATIEDVANGFQVMKNAGKTEITKSDFRSFISEGLGREVSQREISPYLSELGISEHRKHAGPVFYKIA